MKTLSLSTKIFFVSGVILLIFCASSFAILYRAQNQLAVQEMDTLLDNQILALSELVSALPRGRFDFEMSPFFFAHYGKANPTGFFRFLELENYAVLRESAGAPPLNCDKGPPGGSDIRLRDRRVFRTKTLVFKPEIDGELKKAPTFASAPICLMVGIDKAPYKRLVMGTVFSTIPILVSLVLLLIGALLFLVRRLTRDLSKLAKALETTDFGTTHEFPVLPDASTTEVKAVVDKLADLHVQVANVYREMWLFLGRAAHQLKTPVAAIQATVQVLLRKERSKEELLVGLADVESAVVLMGGLIKKLISSSQISYRDSPERERIDLQDFVLELLRMFNAQAEQAGISLHLSKTSPQWILATPYLLTELFGNLIENAILYSPQGQNAKVLISISTENKNIVVSVSDQGRGFSELVQQSLFEPFNRGDERHVAGSGLGLSIARKSAQLLGGDVTLRKSDLTGSEVVVTLVSAN